MATLADLFVSYKSVAPSNSEDETAVQNTATIAPSVKSRLQAFEDAENERLEKERQAEEQALAQQQEQQQQEYEAEPDYGNLDWLLKDLNDYDEQGMIDNASITRYNRGNLASEIQKLFDENGIQAKITSGKRKPGQAGKAGVRSNHVYGNAVDIVPVEGQTFDQLKQAMLSNDNVRNFFKYNSLGVLDETNPATMRQTGATGKHFHIGPDSNAVLTWNQWLGNTGNNPKIYSGDKKAQWTNTVFNAFKRGLKSEYGNYYTDSTYNRIASYMTEQAALESGYGEKANGFNYGGHKVNGQTVHYNSLDDFVKAHLKTLNKWPIMSARSLKDFVNSLYIGNYKYNPSQTPDQYYASIAGTADRIQSYLRPSAKQGGKFTYLRNLHEQSFGKYW